MSCPGNSLEIDMPRQAMLSLQGDIFLKVPLCIAVDKYLGFMAMNSWESALPCANPKYLFTGFQKGGYRLEEIILPDYLPSGST